MYKRGKSLGKNWNNIKSETLFNSGKRERKHTLMYWNKKFSNVSLLHMLRFFLELYKLINKAKSKFYNWSKILQILRTAQGISPPKVRSNKEKWNANKNCRTVPCRLTNNWFVPNSKSANSPSPYCFIFCKLFEMQNWRLDH